MPFNLGIGELLIVLVVALLVFGRRLPEVGRSLGKGLSEFKKGLKGVQATAEELVDETGEGEAAEEVDPRGIETPQVEESRDNRESAE